MHLIDWTAQTQCLIIFFGLQSKLVEEPEHITDQDTTEHKEHQKGKGEMPTTGLKDKINIDGQTSDVGKD